MYIAHELGFMPSYRIEVGMPRELSEEALKVLHESPAVKNVTESGRIYCTTEFRDHFIKNMRSATS